MSSAIRNLVIYGYADNLMFKMSRLFKVIQIAQTHIETPYFYAVERRSVLVGVSWELLRELTGCLYARKWASSLSQRPSPTLPFAGHPTPSFTLAPRGREIL
jgi:hypothetical protein